MKILLLILLPCFVFAQPKKGTIYGRKSSAAINDSIIVWRTEETFRGKLFIGEKTITIGKDQFSIDTAGLLPTSNGTIYTYSLSLKEKQFRCFVYPTTKENEWELLLDNSVFLILYKIEE